MRTFDDIKNNINEITTKYEAISKALDTNIGGLLTVIEILKINDVSISDRRLNAMILEIEIAIQAAFARDMANMFKEQEVIPNSPNEECTKILTNKEKVEDYLKEGVALLNKDAYPETEVAKETLTLFKKGKGPKSKKQ